MKRRFSGARFAMLKVRFLVFRQYHLFHVFSAGAIQQLGETTVALVTLVRTDSSFQST